MKHTRTRISKLGSDAVVRIPAAIARALRISLGDTVTLRVEGTRLLIEPSSPARDAREVALALLTPGGVTRLGAHLAVTRHAPQIKVADVLDALDALVTEGKARIAGASPRTRRYFPVAATADEPKP